MIYLTFATLIALLIIGLLIKNLDRKAKKAKEENIPVKESRFLGFIGLFCVIVVIIWCVAISFNDCSHSSKSDYDYELRMKPD